MNAEDLRGRIIASLSESGGMTLVELHEQIHADSRHMLAVLQSLGGQKLVTCAREVDRGMVWTLKDGIEVVDISQLAPAPSPPPPRAAPPAPRPVESNATVVLRWLSEQQRPSRVRDIIAGTGIASQSVYNTLTDLVRSGRVVKGGPQMRTEYGLPGQHAPPATTPTDTPPPVDKTPVNSEPVAEPVRQPDPEPQQVRETPRAQGRPRAEHYVSLRVSVPIGKAAAVVRAIDEALAA
jgi:hypothetical protein